MGGLKKQDTVAVQALALRLIADRLEHREAIPGPMSKPVQNWPSIKEKPALASLLRVGHEGTSRQSRAETRAGRGQAVTPSGESLPVRSVTCDIDCAVNSRPNDG